MGDEFYNGSAQGWPGCARPSGCARWPSRPGRPWRRQWPPAPATGELWALLCGLALTTPPGDTESETAKLARATFPDIQDPYVTALAEAGRAAKLLAERDCLPVPGTRPMAPGGREPPDRARRVR